MFKRIALILCLLNIASGENMQTNIKPGLINDIIFFPREKDNIVTNVTNVVNKYLYVGMTKKEVLFTLEKEGISVEKFTVLDGVGKNLRFYHKWSNIGMLEGTDIFFIDLYFSDENILMNIQSNKNPLL